MSQQVTLELPDEAGLVIAIRVRRKWTEVGWRPPIDV